MLTTVRRPPPLVTGISPKEGPPGTTVTIRGENLGVDVRDLMGIRICGVDCLLSTEWKSPNKLIARTGGAKGRGDIIVVTRSGGVGSSTVQFRGYNIQIGPLQESAVWIDESQAYHAMFSRDRGSSPIASADAADNPLGISDESQDKRYPKEKLAELFPEGSGNTSQENFIAAWYLLANHQGASFDDLKAGLSFLKRKSSQQKEGPMAFVKGNLTTFLDCLETLKAMHGSMRENRQSESDGSGSIANDLEDTLHKSNKAADGLFHDVLGRKDRADSTRNVLSVLHRYKFLFNLPCSMERNIKKGDFDLVITDYTRAKSLFGDTEVAVFVKVYQEVENRIEAFRQMLLKKLMELPSTVEEQRKLIRYLVHLETPGDPAWECLGNMQIWLLTVLYRCKDEHLRKETEQEEQELERLNPLSPSMGAPAVTIQPAFKPGSKAPQKVLFVDHLTRLLCEHLPDLWRLGQSYFSGKLLKELKANRGDGKKHAEFKKKVGGVVKLYSQLVRAAFLAGSLDKLTGDDRAQYGHWRDLKQNSPIGWLPICVRHVRACLACLTSTDLPSDAMDVLQALAFDMRWNCTRTLLKHAIKDIQNLHNREIWSVDTDDERGGTTLLPTLFENVVNDTIQQLQEVIQAKQGEAELFSQTHIQKEAVELCVQLIQAFADTLKHLAVTGEKTHEAPRRPVMSPDVFTSGHVESLPPLDRRLIIMMGNCNQTMDSILPRLVDLLDKHSYPEAKKIKQAAVWHYKNLDIQLFDSYIEEKANPVIGALEQNMYQGKFDWNACPRPTGVRNYMKEAIMGMIEIHAEVYSLSPNFVHRVMLQVVESVTNEISRLFQCVTGFNQHGALLGRLELQALETTIGAYHSSETSAAIKEAQDCIPLLKTAEERQLLEDLLAQFKSQMKFQLMCFQLDHRTRRTASA